MRIFLSGLMGAGKTTVAQALGVASGLPVFDLDERIVHSSGRSIPELFRERGEAGFRQIEAEVLERWLQEAPRGVMALGGGAVTAERLRRRLLAEGLLVTLDAPLEVLTTRVGAGQGRPLLDGGDVRARLEQLRAQRASAYAECHLRLNTENLSPEAVAREVLSLAADPPIVVPLGTRTYRVEVGCGVRARLGERVREAVAGSTTLLVSDTEIFPHWGPALLQALEARGPLRVVQLQPGEPAKTLASVEALWNAALDAGLDRGSMVVGLGGGVVGDLSGFAAATLLRGVRVGHVPTTLLAMVDSSIGGKTGFDTRHGKNLVGAIHQPSFVLADVDLLSTLPKAEYRAGLAEVVKSAWIAGEQAVCMLERDAGALAAFEPEAALRAIRMAAGLKARVVSEDEHESGLRAVLNLGHTVGHAIEAASGYRGMRHGEAVALGMVAAMRVAVHLGHATLEQAERLRRLLERLSLPVAVDPYLTPSVLSYVASDKKRRQDHVSYIVPGAPGCVEIRRLGLEELSAVLTQSVG